MRPANAPPTRRLLALAAVILAVTSVTACGKNQPLGPLRGGEGSPSSPRVGAGAAGFGSGSFYPLVVGNEWTYEGSGSTLLVNGDGSPSPGDFRFAYTETRRLIGTEHREGTAYVVEEQVHHDIPEDENGPFTSWARWRQDRAGLYLLDELSQTPPDLDGSTRVPANGDRSEHPYRIAPTAWRPGGPVDGSLVRFADRVERVREALHGIERSGEISRATSGIEVTELVYPLHPGLEWSFRPDFPWPARVDGVETMVTPAGQTVAYRLATDPFGTTVHEGEWIYLWYSRQGFLGFSVHLFAEATDADGNPTGEIYAMDESMRPTSINLAPRSSGPGVVP